MSLVLAIVLARVFEAYRDAVDFELGAKPMPRSWHLLKFPQYLSWFMAGLIFLLDWMFYGYWAFIHLGVAVLVAWGVFELCLRYFRRNLRK